MQGLRSGSGLAFVAAVNDCNVLRRHLLESECVRGGRWPLRLHEHCLSAAAAFNPELRGSLHGDWLVWVHQDVHLPRGWDQRFRDQLRLARRRWPRLAVVGVYGVLGAEHVGHIRWRDALLQPPRALPCPVDSLDELLFAVRRDSGLSLDPTLGFDFYGTDLVLQARGQGLDCAVVDAPCVHWTRELPNAPTAGTVARVLASAEVFERKWAHALPVVTSCVRIERPGDTRRHARRMGWPLI
ncbi:hypothetical protein [uncultured Thiohalocapsa sp.]|uniref:hypothetical protein n=1 Tax=uncultured Thiohalocapsa sp. TaxID=768990 RepID=UPI0025FF7C93|nr:hypothetical protein [uncultured Thiohalocapsa sp.]